MRSQYEGTRGLLAAEFGRFLGLLGVTAREPSLEALRLIVRAHLARIPFENISKLYYWKTMGFHASMDLTQYLNGIERFHFGGTCYSCNYHLNELLTHLGYEVRLCGADMSRPDVHLVNIVTMKGKDYLVDVGYAAPFFEPFPLDAPNEQSLSFGTDQYVLSPKDGAGRSRITLYRGGTSSHGYCVNPRPRKIGEFASVIADSFDPAATFMHALLLVKFGLDRARVIHNMTSIESASGMTKKKQLTSTDELVAAIEDSFGIAPAVSRVAIDGLSLQKDAWG